MCLGQIGIWVMNLRRELVVLLTIVEPMMSGANNDGAYDKWC